MLKLFYVYVNWDALESNDKSKLSQKLFYYKSYVLTNQIYIYISKCVFPCSCSPILVLFHYPILQKKKKKHLEFCWHIHVWIEIHTFDKTGYALWHSHVSTTNLCSHRSRQNTRVGPTKSSSGQTNGPETNIPFTISLFIYN